MKTSRLPRVLLAAALVAFAAPAFAVTNIIDNVQVTNVPNVASGDVWILQNGTVATNGGVYVGQSSGSRNSSVVVSGSGTVWSNTSTLYIGYNYAQSNSVVVSSGGFVRVANGFNIADGSAGSNNTLVVTDPGSLFLAASTTRAGDNGYNNLLLVSNGGTFRGMSFVYAGYSASLNQRIMVTGSNSLLDVSASTLEIGYSGTAAKFTVSDGGLASNNIAYLGHASLGASNASALVMGAGSRWITPGQIYVGHSASYNTVLVNSGGYVRVGDLYLGNTPTSVLNQVTVTGAGSVLDSSARIYVGGSGWGNALYVTDGGTVTNGAGGSLGKDASATNNTLVVAGTNTLWYGASGYVVGDIGGFNSLVVTNAARMLPGAIIVGNNSGASNNSILVSGAVLDMKGSSLSVNSANNEITFTGGAVVSNSFSTIGASRTGNRMAVSGPGTLWASTNGIQLGQGAGGNLNRLDVSNGAVVYGLMTVGAATARSNLLVISSGGILTNAGSAYAAVGGAGVYAAAVNQAIVTGPGSRWAMGGGMYVGQNSSGNLLLISNGGAVYNGSVVRLGDTAGTNNVVIITDPGSLWSVSSLDLGREDGLNRVLVLNGGRLQATSTIQFADPTGGTTTARATNNSLRVSGAGSYASANYVYVGAMGTQTNGLYGTVVVDDGGLLEAGVLRSGLTGVISNNGGIFQFASGSPGLVTSNLGVIAVNNGTISFRNVDSAIAAISGTRFTNVTFTGNNAFRLLSATNDVGTASYAVDAGSPSTMYQRLTLAGTNSNWRSGALAVGSGGALLVTNALNASVSAAVTATGEIRVVNSTITWRSNMVVAGLYYSDPSTNTFVTNLTLAASGALQGSNGDLFVFQRSFINQSTNAGQFSLSSAAVLFTNAASHLLSISNSGSLNIGQGFSSFSEVATNFAIGQLSVAANNRVTVAGNQDSLTNALYVGWLDLQGAATNTFDAATNSIFLALDLPNINLYYDRYDPRNDWLNAWMPSSGYDLWGGGLLLPIPEPAPLAAVGAGLALLAFLRRRRVS